MPRLPLSLLHAVRAGRWLLCSAVLMPGSGGLRSQQPATPAPTPAPAPAAPTKASPAPSAQAAPAQAAPAKAPEKLAPEKLDALVAPVALYPDELLGQVLVASTYPLEIIQLQQWLGKNKDLKGKALEDAVKKQPWDPSIQGLAVLPDVVKRLADDITWTTDLGNAFLAQQKDVMNAVQRMRKKALDNGALKTTKEQKVETQAVEGQTIIIVQQANPQVVYVPTYNPVVVYGPPVYPYPPIYYPPPPPPGSMFVAFTVGVALGSAYHHGYGCGWHGNTIVVNHNNVYVNHHNQVNNIRVSGSANWNHNPAHRGAAPYPNNTVANRYGGSAVSNRQTGVSNRQEGISNRQTGVSNRQEGVSNRQTGASNRQEGVSAGTSDRSKGGGASASTSDRAGSRDVGTGGSRSSGFEGGSRDFSRESATTASSRGASSKSGTSRSSGSSRGGGGGRRR